ISSRNPVKNGNDPCPSGWKVPSKWVIADIYNNDGTTDPALDSQSNYTGTNNTWVWRAASNNAVGGAVITNANGERLFMPAVGYRHFKYYILNDIGTYGSYWSSTYMAFSRATNLYFGSNGVSYTGSPQGDLYNGKSNGNCVRCVAE
ncbi:MAG: fibrobacter succinogenes major paralogous domain-containing protein, partial [Bacteroidales bacterium]|nr:fibrobacter succinogenes major paralogous domain-containing protein [Bacteroidales bacterium]